MSKANGQTVELRAVARAADRRSRALAKYEEASNAYREAVVAARATGENGRPKHTLVEIATVASVSINAVRQIIERTEAAK